MYRLFKHAWYWWTWIMIVPSLRHIYFRRYAVTRSRKINWKKPVIITPNHQSALLDALMASGYSKQKPHYLLRADIFKSKLAAGFLDWYDMKPVYRPRDGRENMAKNDAIFEHCYELMGENETLLIWPEGNQQHRFTLRQLKKGVARIALGAEERNEYNLGVQIIPFGTNYWHHWDFQTDVYMNMGDPITIEDCFDAYKRNPAEGMNAVLKKISEKLKDLMINFANPSTYDLLELAKDLYVPKRLRKLGQTTKGLKAEFRGVKHLTAVVETCQDVAPERLSKGIALTEKIKGISKKLKRPVTFIGHKVNVFGLIFRTMGLLFMLPYFLFSLVMNGWIAALAMRFSGKIKDKHWHHSIRYLIGNILFMTWYLVVGIIGYNLIPVPLLAVMFLVFFLPSGMFLLLTYRWYRRAAMEWGRLFVMGQRKRLYVEAKNCIKVFFNELDDIVQHPATKKTEELEEALP